MALSDGHQCQPRRSKPRAMVAPSVSKRHRRRLPRRLRRVRGVAGDAGHAHHPVVQIEVGLERRIVDRPVVGHAVETPHAEVRGAEARKVRAPVDRAAAHRVVHQRRDRRPRVVDRIVLGEPSHVGLGIPVGVAMQLPVSRPVRIGARVDPVPLLQAHDADAGARKHPDDGRAGGASADHEHVGPIVSGHARLSQTGSLPGRCGNGQAGSRPGICVTRRACDAQSAVSRAPKPIER